MYHLQDGAASGTSGGTVAAPSRLPKAMTFEVNPCEIHFPDFELHKTYEASLQLKNTTSETQFVRVARPQSRFLTLKHPRHGVTAIKVAPGLSITYKVLFAPEETSDYTCDLVVTTDHEEFTVPVYALASRGRLTLPESFTVSPCPVRGTGVTPLFLRNTGHLECHWRAEASGPFTVTPSFGVVQPDGGVLPISVEFVPPKLQQYNSVILFRLGPEGDIVQELPLCGNAVEIPLALEPGTLKFPNTFVTLESQLIVRLRNDSDCKVSFTWKSNCTESQEEEETERSLTEQSDAVAHAVISASCNKATRERITRERIETLTKGGRVFDSEVFTIEPVRGVIYAKCVKEFLVVFNPKFAMEYLDTAFLDVDGRQQRIPLQMKGVGLGPQCELEYTRLDIGDIFIGDLHEYKVGITNRGCIEARYVVLLQDTLMGRKFTFLPSEGVLAPGAHETLVIHLQSDLAGLISETFRIHLHGSPDNLTLRFRGRIRGPSLQFDLEELDFGNVSYDCMHFRTVQMLNTGRLPIQFRLSIPELSPLRGSITLVPSAGTLLPKGRQEIRVELNSNTIGNNESVLLVDVEGFGQSVESLPIKVACLVPNLQVSMEQLHYGTCFIGHEYIMNLEVVNTTALLGKYDVILLEEGTSAESASVVVGSSEGSPMVDVILPRSRSLVPIKLTPLAIGGLRMTLYVRVMGSVAPPLPVILTATVRGPQLELDSNSVSFGTLTLLERAEQSIVLRNTSPIPATFSAALTHGERSVYRLEGAKGEIAPYGSMTMKVMACLNDARAFSDEVRLTVRYAEEDVYVINLTARGKGYALVPVEPIDKIEFGDIFTDTLMRKEVVILNKGRRDMDVMWSAVSGGSRTLRDSSAVFRIVPETATILVDCSHTFTVQACTNTPGVVTEEFVLKDKRLFKPIITTSVTGNFVIPVIAYSTRQVVFDYMHGMEGDTGCPFTTKTFTMKNTTARPLRLTLRYVAPSSGSPAPFSLMPPLSFGIESGETHIVGVTCDALYRHDSIAHSVRGRILVVFENHPFTEHVNLIANLSFPTIRVEPADEKLNFGSILADTEKRLELTLTNLSSCVPANFSWSIDHVNTPTKALTLETEKRETQTTKWRAFDVVPFRGTIPPGGKRIVEAVFYGTRGRHETTATCTLDGGPSYKVNLVGWCDATVRFNRTSLDFGVLHYQATAKKTILITSPLCVAVPFTVQIGALKYPGSLSVKPMSGTVTNKVHLTVTLNPMTPDELIETFFLQVGHLDPQPITVRCVGYTNTIGVMSSDKHVRLTRAEDAMYTRCLKEIADREWVPYYKKLGQTSDLPYVTSAEAEAERLALCRNILSALNAAAAAAAATTTTTTTTMAPPQLGDKKTVSVGGVKNGDKVEPPVLSRYILDFGHLTRKEERTATFFLVNPSPHSVSLRMDTRAMSAMPLQINPPKIPMIPSGSKIQMSLTLAAADSQKVVNGTNRFEFFIDVGKGPRVFFEAQCFVATPSLTPCERVVDFGTVLLGHIKKVPLEFVNNEAIPCTWKISLNEPKFKNETTLTSTAMSFCTSSVATCKRQFRVDKDRGTLAPHARMTVQLSFMPRRMGAAKAKLRLSYTSNPDDDYVVLMGNSVGLDVVLSPSPLVFPPVLPCQAIHGSFIITNNEDIPVEVFSMNLDQKHRVELDILRSALNFLGEEGAADWSRELHLPVREAGGSLPEPLVDSVFKKNLSELLLYEQVEMEAAERESVADRRGVSRPSSRRTLPLAAHLDSQTVSLSRGDNGTSYAELTVQSLQKDDPKLVVITGPPFSGKTTQTCEMVQTSAFVELKLDELVRAEAEFDTAEGEIIRNILSGRNDGSPNAITENLANTNASLYVANPGLFFASSEVAMVLHSILKRHLEEVAHFPHLVMDDIKSILTDDRELVLFAVERAASSVGRSLKIISLGVSEATAGLWRNLEIQQKCSKCVEEAKTETLREDAYEQLSAEERDTYNRRLLQFNKCKRALADVQSKVMRFSAERELSRQLTVQTVVDAEIVAREEQDAMLRLTTRGKKLLLEGIQRPLWNQLSEVDRYKVLYTRLRDMGPVAHTVVDGEKSVEEVAKIIASQTLSSTEETQKARQSTSSKVDLLEEARRRGDFSGEVMGFGVWELVDDDYLLRMYEKLENFRFYSTVVRDAATKKAAVKAASQSLVTTVEETTRWVVRPKSSLNVNVVFCSNKVEMQTNSLVFGLTGTIQELVLPVVACTAYPEICRDDKSIFSTTRSRAVAGRQVSRVFLTSKRLYEFGPLIVSSPGGGVSTTAFSRKTVKQTSDQSTIAVKNSSGSLHDGGGGGGGAREKMTFTNVGIFPAEITFTFMKEKDTTFTVVPNKLTLPVGESKAVELCALPEVIGEISSSLVVTVRDNPTPWCVNVSCIGTRPAISLDGKKESLVQFGRCLITRQAERVISIANISSMPVRWSVVEMEKLPKEFELSAQSGTLDVNGVHPLEILFKPIRTGVHNVQLKIEVTDSDEFLYESLPLTLKAEANDVVLEWTRHVDFKLMHVGDTRKETLRILNKGPYEVGYMLRLPKPIRGLVTLSPNEGLLRGLVGFKDASVANIEVSLRFDKEGQLPAILGVVEASFFDPFTNELLYPVQSIPLKGEAWYNRFTIKPSCIDFGSCFADQRKQCSFELRNTGRFPLSFRLFNYKKGPNISGQEEDEAGGRKQRRHTKADATFQLGTFSVSPINGNVAVGEDIIFTVSTLQREGASNRETLGIYVDHCEPELEAKGMPFELIASTTTPGIVADLSSPVDVDTVFEEQQVITSLQHCSKAVRAYAREERIFSFGTVLIGSRVEERFRIANLSPLMCSVKMQLISKQARDGREKEKKEKDVVPPVDSFELIFDGDHDTPNTMQLPSFESRFVTVSFAPSTLQFISAQFEAVVVGGTNPLTSTLRFGLCGEGILPSLEYILPPPLQIQFAMNTNTFSRRNGKGKGREMRRSGGAQHLAVDAANLVASDTIQMPLTLVGMTASRSFTIRNTSSIAAHIWLTTPDELLKDIVISRMKEEILLPAESTETFQLTFSPTEVIKRRVRLRVSITENPFEDRELWLVCESYFRQISFDNIDPNREDHLTLGHWYVSRPKEHTITLRNNSLNAVRFEWNCRSNALSCTPQVGHLSPGSSTPVTLRLFTEVVQNETVNCTVDAVFIEKAEMDDLNNAQLRHKSIVHSLGDRAGEVVMAPTTLMVHDSELQRNLLKAADGLQGSNYTLANQRVQRTLYVSYACDFTSHKVTVPMNDDVEVSGPIKFPKTRIFQRCTTVLRITNTGLSVLPFHFELTAIRDRWSGDIKPPDAFSVDVMEGEVAPQTHRDVHITFAPKSVEDVGQLLIARFPYSVQTELSIPLQGSAECPLIHFNTPDCDYLATRIDGEAGPNLSPDTIPLMFLSCGLQSKSTVSFTVINPTAAPYRYEWIAEPLQERLSPFRCLTPSGSIVAGKQCEMTFEYTATSLSICESKWNFVITGQMSVPFLLVGKAKEPNVFLHTSKVHFGGVMVGTKNERIVELENREDISLHFAFNAESLDTGNSFLSLKPMSGVLRANSKIPIAVTFLPKEEIAINVKLNCRVKRLSDMLTLNVKGEGVCIHPSLVIEDEDADDTEEPILVPPSQSFHLNLGRVQVDTVVRRRFVLSNEGHCLLDYLMVVPEHRFIQLSPVSGVLAPRQRVVMMLIYSPTAEETLRNFKILCKIEKNIWYSIRLSAVCYVPKVVLAFSRYDFGPCFVKEFSSGEVAQTTLSMMNAEAKDTLILDCMLSSDEVFDLDSTSFVLIAGETRKLNISFNPREVGEFTSELKILLNGTYPIMIPLLGEGVIPRVDVSNRFLKLGVARIGEYRTAQLQLECRSRTMTPVSLANCIDAELRDKGVSISPNDTFVMRPRETQIVTFHFKPTIRMPEFHREVRMLVCGHETPFAVLSGSCEDAEVHLDMQSILFDNVVAGAMTSRRIVIMNSGDISQRFKWNLESATNGDIKVIPASGVVRAHSEQTCEFVFNPKKSGMSFQRAVFVEFDNTHPLSVKVEAHSVEQPRADMVLEFSCKVKSTLTRTVSVENTTDTVCTIRPVIDSRLWSTEKKLLVNPRSTATLPVTYSPMMVTKQKDVANLFIPLPTGAARSIQLEGVALQATEKAEVVEKVVETNTPQRESFDVHNGTAQPLRFHISVNWSPEPENGTVTVKAPLSIDLAAGQCKNCPIMFTFMKECSLRGTVYFCCHEREDMTQGFDVAFRVLPRAVSSVTELVTTVRSAAVHSLHLTNSLSKSVTFNTRVENGSDAVFVNPTLTIPGKGAADLLIRFFPLLHKEYPVATVTATSTELGTTSCKLLLQSKPPRPEKVTQISCSLGQSIIFPLQFTCYSRANCDFTVRIPGDAKTTPFTKVGSAGSVKVPGTTRPEGQKVTVEIQYEPTTVGEIKEMIEITSPVAGLYIFPVLASCLPPQRQGPFLVRPGQVMSIPFKNVFNDPITLSISIDSPNFVVQRTTENVAPKKMINFAVSYKTDDTGNAMRTAKLTVSGMHHGKPLQWLYYLKRANVE